MSGDRNPGGGAWSWFRRCQHLRTRCIHGDEAWARMSTWRGIVRRQACIDCGRALDRPPLCSERPGVHESSGEVSR